VRYSDMSGVEVKADSKSTAASVARAGVEHQSMMAPCNLWR